MSIMEETSIQNKASDVSVAAPDFNNKYEITSNTIFSYTIVFF